MSIMERGVYAAQIDLDPDEGMFRGRILNIRDVVTFYGRSVADLEREFDRSIATYLAVCEEKGIEPEKPFSGQFIVRTSPELHRAATIAAAKAGTSLNAWVENILASLGGTQLLSVASAPAPKTTKSTKGRAARTARVRRSA